MNHSASNLSHDPPLSDRPCCPEPPVSDHLLAELTRRSTELAIETQSDSDLQTRWPADQFRLLAEQQVLGWGIPAEYGGTPLEQDRFLEGYLRLAAACLTTAFVLTQRNGACQRIAGSTNDRLKDDLLPLLARGEIFATVGISHLTTSRQHWHKPTVGVQPCSGGFRFEGEVPWVTSASKAQYIITGGSLPDGRQVLAALPAQSPGVTIEPPVRLLALSASQTSAVRLSSVEVESRWVLAGPAEEVMKKIPGSSTGSLSTSALALGLSHAATRQLEGEAEKRPELRDVALPLRTEWTGLHRDLMAAAQASALPAKEVSPAASSEALRARANSLVLRSTQALLGASKGAGFVAGHFAERAVREALFFLVWSCPQPVLAAALRSMAAGSGEGRGDDRP
jgi:alkylation response protein AidB-like acyl-CoA dehydrogenase